MSARDQLIRAGERLFAERGLDGASLREISRTAEQRNVTAVQYHFSTREGLLVAILDKHVTIVSRQIHVALDTLEDDATGPGARDVVRAVADPLLGRLSAPGGPEFLQIAAQVMNRAWRVPRGAQDPLRVLVDDDSGAWKRWAATLEPWMSPLVSGAPLHQRFSVLRFAYLELARRAREPRRRPPGELFAAHLVDLMTALALAPPSPETERALGTRTARP